MGLRKLETCLSPALYEADLHSGSIVVIIDILRASSAICTAFENGAVSIIPVAEVHEAKEYKSRGYLVAAERDGFVLDFADFGNSPFNFTQEKVSGKTIVYSTTNGTGIIKMASSASAITVGSFLNISALAEWLIAREKDVVLFCAGWKNRFNLEDTVCAGAFAERLMNSRLYSTICDSTLAALDLWALAKNDLPGYIEKAAQRSRLKNKGLDDCLHFCLTPDFTRKIPVIKNGILVDNNL
ncbi:MAG: 2-phosphosulfolactate phosphatase [Bacteroidales bacterium]|jgi:2-phosphosulfolactate phosphatase|nr:2-phosphosulfolactate phosphatase [Bacteroidales bacterium]